MVHFCTGLRHEDNVPWLVIRYRLLEAARLLFENPKLREKEMLAYINDDLLKVLDEDTAPSVRLDTLVKDKLGERKLMVWRQFGHGINRLRLYLIAFAPV